MERLFIGRVIATSSDRDFTDSVRVVKTFVLDKWEEREKGKR